MATPIEPLEGAWPFSGLPPIVTLGDRRFTRSIGLKNRDGVIAQYREAVPQWSLHLYVLEGGRYVIDHVDEFNPHAHPVRHFLADVMPKNLRDRR